jgi:FMN reductase
MSTVGVVVGNPKPRSRTLEVAEAVATAAAEAAGLEHAERLTIDLADLGPQLFDWSSSQVHDAVDAVRECSLVVVASPTYKASYTGLLKAFLDWFSTTALETVAVVPVMVGAGPHHALAVEVHLRPLLIELGASLPTRGLYVLEAELGELDAVVASWLHEAGPRLRAAVEVAQLG